MIKVKPRAGIILAGIPAKGAEVPDKLAEEWLANRLVVRVEEKRKRGRPRKHPQKAPQAPRTAPVAPEPPKDGE